MKQTKDHTMQVESADELINCERIPTVQADYPVKEVAVNVDLEKLNVGSQASNSVENIIPIELDENMDKENLLDKTQDTRVVDGETKMTKRHNLHTILDDIY